MYSSSEKKNGPVASEKMSMKELVGRQQLKEDGQN